MELINKVLQSDDPSNLYLNEIQENISKYRLEDINDLDPEHSFIPTDKLISLNIYNYFIYLKIYHCVITGHMGVTLTHDYGVVKPFKILKHKWLLTQSAGYYNYYTCKECSMYGYNKINSKYKAVYPSENQISLNSYKKDLLTCEEYLIKSIIE